MSVSECVRCSANKVDGDRCTRRTCEYPEMCWQHFQKEHHLKLAKSHIRGADKGLFTMEDLTANQRIGEYTGEISRAPVRGPYVLEVSRGRYIDAKSTQSGIVRYINHCKTEDRRRGYCRGQNVTYRRHHGHVNVVAKQRIPAGSELFVSYGRTFFR